MKYTITRRGDLPVNVWSGGKTTQLFLYPPESSYERRDFFVRVSSATVEQETSVFTSLPGFRRILMPLTGPLKLVYDGHGEALIQPFEAAEFDGGWHTVSYGKCTDIGIMLADGWQGSLSAAGAGTYTCGSGFTGVYALADTVTIDARAGGETARECLNPGDFFLMEAPPPDTVLNLSMNAPRGAVIARTITDCPK